MGDIVRATHFRLGAHDTVQQWTTVPSGAPAGLKFVCPEEGVEVETDYDQIARNIECGDGENRSALQGNAITKVGAFQVPLVGVSGPGAADGVGTDILNKTNVAAELLQMLTGSAPGDGEGDTTSATPGTGTTVQLDGVPAVTPIGKAFLIQGATSGLLHAREVTALASADMTITHALTDDLGAAENPSASAVAFGGAVFVCDPTNGDHFHVYGDFEAQNWRRRLYGLIGNAVLDMPSGGYARLNFSELNGSNWDNDSGTLLAPNFSASPQGLFVKVVRSPLYLNGALYMAKDLSFDFGLELADRGSEGAPAGKFGMVVGRHQPKLSFTLHSGTITSPLEVTDAFLASLQGEATFDVNLQVGRVAGGSMLLRIPAADITAKRVRGEGGQYMVQCEAMATAPTLALSPLGGMYRIHLL